MACYEPIPAKRGQERPGQPDYKPKLWATDANLALPCGKCVGCITDRATHWARRSYHEMKLWDSNIFITLTYADEHLPPGGQLEPAALAKFIKRLRRRIQRGSSSYTGSLHPGPRYLACGEYGEEQGRPHYHGILFNTGFRDAYQCGVSKRGEPLYESPELSDLWPFGKANYGHATPASANYIAQYTLKKQRGFRRNDVLLTRAQRERQQPFLRMSLNPAIGYAWLDQFKSDLQHGYLVADGFKNTIPRAYLKRLSKIDPQLADSIQEKKERYIQTNTSDKNTVQRLQAGKIIHTKQKQSQERK